jgi:hypothetical protein
MVPPASHRRCNLKYAQQQLGDASAAMTLDTYAVLFDHAGQAERATAAMVRPSHGSA